MADNNDTPQAGGVPPAPAGNETVYVPAPPKRAPGEGSLPIGTQLNHIYQVNRFIARGGMAEVYEGENVTTGERVAIKIILGHLKSDEAMQGLFLREARTLTRLNHTALVLYRVLAREPDLGVLYIVTEFVDGVPLEKLIGSRVFTEVEQRGLLKRLAEGLKVAHDLGAIHRDISPDNIMAPEGRLDLAKVIDFGIAKDLLAEKGTLIGDGFAGKLAFVAPEQFGDFGREIGPWTDVYSLGLCLLAVANGAPVDMGATLVDAMDRRRAGPDVSKAPESLKPVLAGMLQADPKKRLRSMDEVLTALAGVPSLAPAPRPPLPEPVVAGPSAEDQATAAAAAATAAAAQEAAREAEARRQAEALRQAAEREVERGRLFAALQVAEAAFEAARAREAAATAAAETSSATLAQAASQLRGVVDMGAGGTVVQAARQELSGAADIKGQNDNALQAARDAVAEAAQALSQARIACGISDHPPPKPQPVAEVVAPLAPPSPTPLQPQTIPPVAVAPQPQPFVATPPQQGGAGRGLLFVGGFLVILILIGVAAVLWARMIGPHGVTRPPAGPVAQTGPLVPGTVPPGPATPGPGTTPATPPDANPGGDDTSGNVVTPDDTIPAAPVAATGANLAGSWAVTGIGCGQPAMYVRIRVNGDRMGMTIAGENQTGHIISGDPDSARVEDEEGITRFMRVGDSMTLIDANGQRMTLTRCSD